MVTMTLQEQTKAEYDRCLNLNLHPEQAPDIGMTSLEAVALYYAYRAEALGWVLDRMERE